jgi:hypothetical protein
MEEICQRCDRSKSKSNDLWACAECATPYCNNCGKKSLFRRNLRCPECDKTRRKMYRDKYDDDSKAAWLQTGTVNGTGSRS